MYIAFSAHTTDYKNTETKKNIPMIHTSIMHVNNRIDYNEKCFHTLCTLM